MTFFPDQLVLRTQAFFLPKVVAPLHIGKKITLLLFFTPPHTSKEERLHSLDPKRGLRFYINRTKEHCVDNQLFVGFAGAKKGNAVQKRTISRWIMLFIKIWYALAKMLPSESLQAHSTITKAATTALACGVPLLDICQAATWASLPTFMNHYCLDGQDRLEGHFAHLVLQDFFGLSQFTDPPPGRY